MFSAGRDCGHPAAKGRVTVRFFILAKEEHFPSPAVKPALKVRTRTAAVHSR
jgi:hypothetical protein